MAIVTARPISATTVRPSTRTVSTLGGADKVTGWDNQPAAGRTVLLIARNQWGRYEVRGQGVTDVSGDYSITVTGAGPLDVFVVVGIGDPAHGEYSRALGQVMGVE